MAQPSDKDDSESKGSAMSNFGKWLAGIVGSIIVGCAVYYLTRPPTPPPPPPQPSVTTFEGMVYSGSAPVAKAMVEVDLTGDAATNGAVHDVTDENGAYLIKLTGLPTTAGATLVASAAGYQNASPQSLSTPLQSDNRLDLALTPVAPAPSPGVPAPMGPLGHRPVYIRKGAAQAAQFKFQPKEKPKQQ